MANVIDLNFIYNHYIFKSPLNLLHEKLTNVKLSLPLLSDLVSVSQN